MADFIKFDPSDFSEDELVSAARGERTGLKPQLAVVLLRAKLGDAAERRLAEFATDESLDSRTRHAAVAELRRLPGSRALLNTLRTSADQLVADEAAKAFDDT